MNPQYNYLNISIRNYTAGSAHDIFRFPAAGNVAPASIDILSLESHFVALDKCYSMAVSGSHRTFSAMTFHDNLPGGTRVSLCSLTLPADALIPGRQITGLLDTLTDIARTGHAPSDAEFTEILRRQQFPTEPLKGGRADFGAFKDERLCYRTYVSGTELAAIFSFPRQHAYEGFPAVLIVPATVAQMPDDNLVHITEPVNQKLTVVCPPRVTASAALVGFNDRLTLTYSCPDYDSQTVTFEVGTTNRYVRIQTPALVVNNAATAGISFDRRVPFRVVSSTGDTITQSTILINGRTANRTEAGFAITSDDFSRAGTVSIDVSSTNYRPLHIDATAAELFTPDGLTFTLEPERSTVLLRIDFGRSRIIESEIQFEKKDKEYTRLRAGNFHGFRAHRVLGAEQETYNIDTTNALPDGDTIPVAQSPTLKPAYPLPEKMTPEPKAKTKPAPENPKVTVKPGDTDAPVKKTMPQFIEDKEVEEQEIENIRSKRLWIGIAVSILILAVAGGIIWYLRSLVPASTPGSGQQIETVTQDTIMVPATTGEVTPSPVAESQPDAAPAEAPTADTAASNPTAESADMAYLKDHSVWERSALQSDAYRNLYDLITTGDIDAIAAADYFASGKAAGTTADKVVDLLWAAKGTGTEKSNTRALTALKGKKSIDINKLYDTLARYRDKQPNTTPRPGK